MDCGGYCEDCEELLHHIYTEEDLFFPQAKSLSFMLTGVVKILTCLDATHVPGWHL